MIGIYKITSPSGRVYIGQSWDIKKRWRDYGWNRCTKQIKLYNSFLKYGVQNHKFQVIIELLGDVEQMILDIYEQFYMDFHRKTNISLLNIREAGSHGKYSEETKFKMRKPKVSPKQKEHQRKFVEISRTGEIRQRATYNTKEFYKNNSYSNLVTFYQYTIDSELVAEWTGLNIAAKALNIQMGNLSKAVNGRKDRPINPHYYKGFLWFKNKL